MMGDVTIPSAAALKPLRNSMFAKMDVTTPSSTADSK